MKAGVGQIALLTVLVQCLSGCVVQTWSPAELANSAPALPDAADNPLFAYRPGPAATLSAPMEKTRYHDVRALALPSVAIDDGSELDMIYFQSRQPGAKKLVVVMPIWGKSGYPPSKLSSGYARRSRGEAHVIRVLDQTPLFDWDAITATRSDAELVAQIRQSSDRYRKTVIQLRRLLDWAESRQEIAADRVAFVGFSMSALVVATLLGNDPRPAAAVLMMGAARYADIFATCGNKVGELRQHVTRGLGWRLERYHDFVEELFAPADPVQYEGRYDPRGLLLIEPRFDDCMPLGSRDALWQVTGQPRRMTLLARHRTAFYYLTPLGLNVARRRIYDFLDLAL